MARNTRNFPKDEENNLRDTIQKLRNQVRKLRKNIKELESENSTLLEAWVKTEHFLEEVTDGVPLEDLLKYKKLPKNVVKKKTVKVENLTKKESTEEVRKKWAKWRKENL
jgi:enamine deaminase RidA (YjgF/YER057c/UK114 family)